MKPAGNRQTELLCWGHCEGTKIRALRSVYGKPPVVIVTRSCLYNQSFPSFFCYGVTVPHLYNLVQKHPLPEPKTDHGDRTDNKCISFLAFKFLRSLSNYNDIKNRDEWSEPIFPLLKVSASVSDMGSGGEGDHRIAKGQGSERQEANPGATGRSRVSLGDPRPTHGQFTGTECMDGGAGKGLPFTCYYIPDFLTHWVWGLLFCYHREIKLHMLI